MPRRAYQAARLLALRDIFWQETDEAHPLMMKELTERLNQLEFPVTDKTVLSDIEALQQYGLEIEHPSRKGYYLAERTFELAELRLLVDAVQASKFITAKKSRALIAKLEQETSRHQAQTLQHQVFVSGRTLSDNEAVLYAIDAIHSAISRNRQITFQYFDYDLYRAKVVRHGGKRYRVSPYYLVRSNEFYYLIAWDSGSGEIRNYRVDKLLRLTELDEKREGAEEIAALDIERYTDTHFSMFSGEPRTVTLRCKNWVAKVLIDRFGDAVTMAPDGDEHFTATVEVAVSPQFYGWLFSLGTDVQLTAPEEVREGLRAYLRQLLENA